MNLPEEVSGHYPKQLRNRDVASGLAKSAKQLEAEPKGKDTTIRAVTLLRN